MRKVLFAGAVLTVTAALATPLLAADGPTGATRHAIGNACAAEVQKFCPDESRAGKIARCLRPHKDELSEECQTAAGERAPGASGGSRERCERHQFRFHLGQPATERLLTVPGRAAIGRAVPPGLTPNPHSAIMHESKGGTDTMIKTMKNDDSWLRAGWIALITAATVIGSFVFACATPFPALGALAALHLPRRDAFVLVGVNWLVNQIIGYGFLHYPMTWDSLRLGCRHRYFGADRHRRGHRR